MSQDEIKEQIAAYLGSHPFLNLATLSAQGAPQAHTLAFAAQGAAVYFGTRRDTRKAGNMTANPQVAYTVDQDQYGSFAEITGVQMEGVAKRVSDPQEIALADKLYKAKFGEAASITPSEMHIVFKIEPQRAYYLNYAKGFGHKDLVEY